MENVPVVLDNFMVTDSKNNLKTINPFGKPSAARSRIFGGGK